MFRSHPLAANARWLWSEAAAGPNHYVEFSREIPAGAGFADAWIQLSAETLLRLWVNGEPAYVGPPREVPPYFYFDTIDLKRFWREGVNRLCIVAHHQGANSQSRQAGTPAMLVAGLIYMADGTRINLAEPSGWRARRVARYRADAHRLFSCIGFSEHVDFGAEENPWGRAVTVAAHPWDERPVALPRDLPAWRETVRRPVSLEASNGGWLVDMGEEISGYVELSLCTAGRVSLTVAYAEALIGGCVDAAKGGMNYSDRLELVGGETAWCSFDKRAFRFLQLDQSVEVKSVRVIEHVWPYEPAWAGIPEEEGAEGKLIRRIREVSARTIELNTEDLLTDCPWRERAQYLDCQFYMGAMWRLFGTLEPIRRFLRQFPRGADETGLLRMCYPSPAGMTIIPDYSLSFAILLRRYFELGGDLETIRENLRFAERGVTAFARHEDAHGLLADVPGWIFLDNTFDLPKQPRSAALNAIYHGGLRALAALRRACGDPAGAVDFDARADRVRQAFRAAFLRGGRLLDSDSTPEHEAQRRWIYHHGSGRSGAFRLRVDFRKRAPSFRLRLAVHGSARARIDGAEIASIREGGSWSRSAIHQPIALPSPADSAWHCLELEVGWNAIDWECHLFGNGEVEWRAAAVTDGERSGWRPVALRPNPWPWLTQTTVGYTVFHGLLEPEEARVLLRACLPARYVFPVAQRTTPFFAEIGDLAENERRILPCNVPASLFHFCHALKNHGMASEAREFLLPLYAGMLERGATTWWEEWNTGSSLCHAWASFVVEFLDPPRPTERVKSRAG